MIKSDVYMNPEELQRDGDIGKLKGQEGCGPGKKYNKKNKNLCKKAFLGFICWCVGVCFCVWLVLCVF